METKQYQKDEIIFREGDKAKCMYEIQEGLVGIYAGYGTPDMKLLTILKSGETFGEMAMIEAMPRSATAVVTGSHATLQIITWQTLGEYFREQPGKVVIMMQQMGRRIRELTKDYMEACKAIANLAEKAEAEKKEEDVAWINSNMRRYLDAYHAYSAYDTGAARRYEGNG